MGNRGKLQEPEYELSGLIEEDVINDIEGLVQAISIGFIVATFLLNTGRALKAIEICKECLLYLNNEVLKKEEQLVNLITTAIYLTMFKAYSILSDYTNACAYLEKALAIRIEVGDREGEASCYGNLGTVFRSLGEYDKAKEYLEKALAIRIEIGDREGEATDYGNLGTVFQSLGEYDKAEEYHEKALAIRIEIGDRKGEATDYGNLGIVFQSLGEYDKAKEYHEKALAIRIEIEDREGEATDYGNLGTVFQSLGEYDKAKEYHEKALAIKIATGNRNGEATDYGNLGTVFASLGEYDKAKEYLEKALVIKIEIGDRAGEASSYANLGTVFRSLGEYDKAKEYQEKALAIRIEIGDRKGEASCYGNLGTVFYSLGEYDKAKEYQEKALAIRIEIGDRKGEASCYGNLGTVFASLGEYDKAKEYHEKALAIRIEIGDREGEATDYGNLGTVFQSLGEYDKAKEYLEKALAIRIEIEDREGEATDYGNLGTVFQSLGEYDKAEEYHEKALAIRIEIGDREGEATDYGNLGIVFQSLGEYDKAKEYHEKALAIRIKIGDREGEATNYGNLGTVFASLGEYDKAKEYLEKALVIKIEIADRAGEASSYANLGTVFRSLGEYKNAKEYLEKALAIRIEIGDRRGEASSYANLGTVFRSLGEYDKAKEYQEKALAIRIEIGDRKGEASCYGNLGNVFYSLGEYDKAKEYHEKALAIRIEIGDRKGEASCYGNLGNVFHSLGEYDKAKEYHQKALAISIEIGDREGEASSYGNLGNVFHSLGEYDKAKEYLEKALAIRIEIGNREGEASSYGNLGTVLQSLGEYIMAEGYISTALSISKDIGHRDQEFQLLCNLALLKLFQGNDEEMLSYLLQSINKSENLRGFLKDNDQFKISFSDVQNSPFRLLSAFFCLTGNPNNALYVEELARGRALADLMATQYSVESEISANPQSWIGIENIIKKESNCVCLYISYFDQDVFLWILKTSGVIRFRRITVNENIVGAGLVGNLADFFDKNFRSFGILPEESCEDRSLNVIEPKLKSFQEESLGALRLVEEDDEEIENCESSLSLCYKLLIASVADLLDEPEIIIVPNRSLNQVPFAALSDEGGKYLSATFRIRIVPSLTTLKLIQDSPADYHSQTGALIVGDPVVGRVRYMGRVENFKPLPCARKEAEMIGELLSVQPLLGQCATKQAVLERLHSGSLIHFAAHGNAERGEIALSPPGLTKSIPQEKDYLLTMSDISQVRLRAKLVVLSCCHSGRGQIRAEGVVGIARAFLGSGVRSVLVALWAIEDRATEQLMHRFYEHLVRGESASESLQEAMKWMRNNGFAKVSEWAPFMLIGDNVTFKFEKENRQKHITWFIAPSPQTVNRNKPGPFPVSDPGAGHVHSPEKLKTSTTRTELCTRKDTTPALRPESFTPSHAAVVNQCTSERLVVGLQTGLASTSAQLKVTRTTNGTRTVVSPWPNILTKGATIPSTTCQYLLLSKLLDRPPKDEGRR
ncbi:hypothetical protein ACROYT_G001932 [Oculina patagonica]